MFDPNRLLKLRRGLMVVPGEQAVHIRSLRRTLLLRGRTATTLLPQVLANLDGVRTVDEVAVALGHADEVKEIAAMLERAGILQPVIDTLDSRFPGGLLALLDGLGADVPQAVEKLSQQRVGALVSDRLASYAQACFKGFGIDGLHLVSDFEISTMADWERDGEMYQRLEKLVSNWTVLFVAMDRWQPSVLRAVNQICVAAKRPWIAVRPENEVKSLIGPFVVPGQTACYACLERRRHANLMESAELQMGLDRLADKNTAATVYLTRSVGPLFEPAVAMAVTEVVKYAAGLEFYLSTLNQVVACTPFTLETEAIPVLKLPRCHVCSRVASTQAQRVWMGE